MSHYLYFINIDNKYVKFGITSCIYERMRTHKCKFVNRLKLKEKFDILSLIKFNNNIINEVVEGRFKKYLKKTDKYIDVYNETEIFDIKDFDSYKNLIYKMINNVMEEYGIKDDSYKELDSNKIDSICDLLNNNIKYKAKNKTKYKTKYNAKNKNTNIKKLCLRCGKKFSRLDIHTQRKKQCEALRLNISYEDMKNEYDKYYKEYAELSQYKCDHCPKSYMHQSGLSKHKNKCKNKFKNDESLTDESITTICDITNDNN